MRSTRIVTSFVTYGEKFLILRRSKKSKSMGGLWSAVSGIIEGAEEPLDRARTEIREETGLGDSQVRLIRSASMMRISSPQYENHEWLVYPFLFEATSEMVRLNPENVEFRWISHQQLRLYRTVPSLDQILSCLL